MTRPAAAAAPRVHDFRQGRQGWGHALHPDRRGVVSTRYRWRQAAVLTGSLHVQGQFEVGDRMRWSIPWGWVEAEVITAEPHTDPTDMYHFAARILSRHITTGKITGQTMKAMSKHGVDVVREESD